MNKLDVKRHILKIKHCKGIITVEECKSLLRMRREVECFKFVNRGRLWHNRLTLEQMIELETWYTDWLDVTDTLTVPIKPAWLV